MADTKAYLDYINQKKRNREKIENVDFSKMPEGVDVMAVAEELASGLAPEYADEIRGRARRKEPIKGLDYSQVKFAEPEIEPTPPMQPAPMPLNIVPQRPDVPPVGVAPTLPSPTKEQLPRPLTESIPQRAKSFARGTVGVASGAAEGFGDIAGALGAVGVEDAAQKEADFLNEFSQRHLSNPENDLLDDIMQGLGSTLPFMGLGRAVAGGTRLAGNLAKTQKGLDLAKKLGSVFGISSLAVANALTEGGHAAQELRYEGVGKEKQQDAFWKTFIANIPLTLALDRWMIGGAAGNRLKAAMRGGQNEFVEETLQNFITKLSQDKPIDLGEALYEGGIGAIVGGGMGAAFPGARPSAPEAAPEPLPTLPLSPNLDEAGKSRALQMAQTDPVAAMKSVTPSQAWPEIDEMARSFAEAAEADQSIPAEQKRTAVQSALTEMLNMSLAPATGAAVEGVEQGMPAPAVPQDPQRAFMTTQIDVIRKVAEKAGLKGGQVAEMVSDRVRGGEVRGLVEKGMAEGKNVDQMADEFLAQFEGAQVAGEAIPATTPTPQAETATEGQPEAAGEAITGRWSDILPEREAQGGQAVAAIDMTDDGAGAVILKTGDGRFTVRSEVVDVVSPHDEDGLYFNSLAEAKEAVELALPEPGKSPVEMTPERAIPVIQAMPGAEAKSIPEARVAYEAAKEQARAEGEPVFEDEPLPADEEFTPPPVPDNPGLMPYEQASEKFPGLTQEQHKALVRGAVAANLAVPEGVIGQYPDMAEEMRAEAQEGLAAGEAPTGNPILKLIRSKGFINRENYERHWKGELPADDMKFYIRKNGKATISEIAEAAAEEGLIPEYSENALFEAIGSELRERAAVMYQGPVKSDIQEQLEAVGRPPEEAAADAAIVAAYVEAEAARRGMTPEQFYGEKRRILVERGMVEPSEMMQEGIEDRPMWADELESVGGKIDSDGTVLVWHATTKEKAEQILKDGFLRRPADAPDSYGVYVGTGDNYQYLGESYGDGTLVPIRIKAKDLNIEDVGPGRLITFYAKTKGGVYRPTAIGEKALTPPTLEQPAFHGSPYNFDKFTLEHIGKGEGAQAYGWGLYFAGNKEVAEYYRDSLTEVPAEYRVKGREAMSWMEKLQSSDNQVDLEWAEVLESILGKHTPLIDLQKQFTKENGYSAQTVKAVNALKPDDIKAYDDDGNEISKGHLYEVSVPEDDVLLDWDNKADIEKVKPAILEAINSEKAKAATWPPAQKSIDHLKAAIGEKTWYDEARIIQFKNPIGASLYGDLANVMGSDKAASELLNKHGIKGIKYLDQQSRGKGEGSYNYVIFDDSAIEILNRYYQGPRASINVLAHKIRLGEFADSSSFIHEAAHDFLQDMADYVAEGKASQEYLGFWEPVKSWLDLKDGKAITRDQHEKFARGFEAFMREGKAPTSTLERVFRTFRDWLLKIYKSVTDLNVDLNDSMRKFFGDMLTAQETELTALTEEAKAAAPEPVETLEQGPAPGFYNPRAYQKVIAKLTPGALLTARGRIQAPGAEGGAIPRAAVVKLISVDPATGQAIVDFKGQPVFTRLDMFRETYQKPAPMETPGIPVRQAIELATGLTQEQQQVVTTESRALRAKLATEEKAARTAAKFTKAQILEDIRENRKDGEAIRKEAIEYVKMTVPKASQWRFIQSLTAATTKTRLAKIIVRADEVSDIAYRKGLAEDIKKVSSRALESMRVEVNYREAVRDLLAEFDLAKRRPETILKLKALQDYVKDMESRGQEVFLPDEMYKRLEILALRPIEQISNGELENALRDLYILEAVGKEAQGQKELAQAIEKGEWVRELAASATPIESLPAEATRIGRAWNWAQETYWALSPMSVMTDRLDGGRGTHDGAHAKMKAIIDGDFFKFLDLRRRYIQPVFELAEKYGFDDTNMDRIGIYAFKVQKDGVARVLASMPEMTEEFIVNLKLTPQEMEVYQKMREGMEALYPEVKRVMGKLYNKEVGKIDNYFSMITDWDKLLDTEVVQRMSFTEEEFSGWRKNISAGFTKQRKAGAKAPIKVNSMKVFIQHITDAAYLIAMQENVKKFSEVISDETYKEAVGPIGHKIMTSWMDIIARQGKAEGSKKIPLLDTLRVNMGSATLGFKLSSFLIQSTAFMDGAALVGGQNILDGFSKVMSDKGKRVWLLENFPKLRERVGDDIAFKDLSQTEWLRKIQTMGYVPLKWLDGMVASSTVMAAYNKKAAEVGAPLAGEGPLNAEAVEYTNFALDRTQASPFFIDTGVAFNSPHFLLGNVSLNKAILQFKQFVMNRWFFMSYDIPRLQSKGDIASAYAWLAAAGAAEMGIRGVSKGIVLSALASVGLGISSAVKGADDDDEMWKDYALTLIGMCPFLDAPISAIKYGSYPVPVMDNSMKFFIGAREAYAGQNGYKRLYGLRQALRALATTIGIPGTAQVGQILSYAYNPKTLTFPYNEEYRELVDIGGSRTKGEQQRLNELHKSKAQFAVQARIYRSAMERGDTQMAAKAARQAAEALEGL